MSDDLISRQAAINAMCDACDTVTAACPHFPCKRYLAIELLQSIDTVQIVRCKNCKHREVENGFCEGRGWPMQLVPDDGFCDKGERSEE